MATSGPRPEHHRWTDTESPHTPVRNRPRGRQLEDLLPGSGPPLTTTELARMIGMSATFIRDEIRNGHLHAVLLGRGRKRVFRISVCEARRYAKQLGLM
jgi:hypothetical protein